MEDLLKRALFSRSTNPFLLLPIFFFLFFFHLVLLIFYPCLSSPFCGCPCRVLEVRLYEPYLLRRDIATADQIAVPVLSIRIPNMNVSLFLNLLFPVLNYSERAFWSICEVNELLRTESNKRKLIEDGPNDEESQNIVSELENDSYKSLRITCTQLNQKIQEIQEDFWRGPRNWFQIPALYILCLWKLTKYQHQSSIHSIEEREIHLKSVFVTSVPENSFDSYSRLLTHPLITAL